jgi:hypothetical protein
MTGYGDGVCAAARLVRGQLVQRVQEVGQGANTAMASADSASHPSPKARWRGIRSGGRAPRGTGEP